MSSRSKSKAKRGPSGDSAPTVERLALWQQIALAISSAEDLNAGLRRCLKIICDATDWVYGEAWLQNPEGTALRVSPAWYGKIPGAERFGQASAGMEFERGRGLPGRVWDKGAPVWDRDVSRDRQYQRRQQAAEAGLKSAVAIPIHFMGELVAVLVFYSAYARGRDDSLVEFLTSLSSQLGTFVQQKRISDALRASESRLQAILDNVLDAIVTIDDRGRIESFNRGAERIFGYSAAEVIGKNVKVLMPEPYHSEHDTYLENYKRTGVAKIIGIGREVIGRRKDGSTFPLDIAVTEMRLGIRRLYTGILRDLSERKRAEEELRHSQKMEAVGRLAGGVVHDFNNLLTAIIGASQLIGSRLSPGDPLLEVVDELRKIARRGSALTAQLLAFSRKQVLQPRVFDVNTVIGESEKLYRKLLGESIDLVLRLEKSPAKVKVDPNQLDQAIMNLIANARDAMPGGGTLTIETACLTLAEDEARTRNLRPGPHVMIAVQDTGTGMTPEVQARVFEPFFTTKPSGKGTGLGLPTVYGIVKQSGGHVGVESRVNEGTTFRILLPFAAEDPAQLAEKSPAAHKGGNEVVLLVEDERVVRMSVGQVLRQAGYTVLEAANGREALSVCGRHAGPLHLVISDVIMPEMGGRELSREFVKRYPGIKVLFVSGYTGDEFEADAAFLQKPFTPEVLAKKVRDVLDAR